MSFIPLRIRYAGLSALLLAWPIAHAIGQGIEVRMDADGRTFGLVAPGLTAFRGGFAAEVWSGGEQKILSSRFGTRVDNRPARQNLRDWLL